MPCRFTCALLQNHVIDVHNNTPNTPLRKPELRLGAVLGFRKSEDQ